MTRPLRIALTADPELPVPPKLYGGIERIVDMLAIGLSERGHAVTVFAHRDSSPAGRLVAWPGQNSRSVSDTARNAVTLASELRRGGFDVVHSFSRVAYLTPILPMPIAKIMTYQRAISARSVGLGHRLSRGTLEFTAISSWMMRHVEHLGRWRMVPNGVPSNAYTYNPCVPADAPLVFLGRIEEIKGPHLAIEIAKRSNTRLVIAGNIPNGKQTWFDTYVSPHLDGESIRYIGPVDDKQKNEILGSCKALLMPILWDEPFGIVMAEAMACGTPVLALRRGAAPEVVKDGVTGFVRDDLEGLVQAVGCLGGIRRADCRARVEYFYNSDAVVEGYLAAYAGHKAFALRPR